MNREQLRVELKAIFEEDTGKTIPVLADDLELQDGLGLDSLDVVSLVMQIEQQYRIRLSHDELAAVTTVGQLLAFIHGKLEPTSPATLAFSREAPPRRMAA